MNDDGSLKAKLDAIAATRGYVMAHHGVMALTAPALLDAYDTIFTATKRDFTLMSQFERNLVWIMVVATQQIPLGGHHVKDFIGCGGTIGQVETVAALAAFLVGAKGFNDYAASWQAVAPDLDFDATYRRSITAISRTADKPIPEGLLEVALAAAQSCRQNWVRVADHIRGAKQAGVADDMLAAGLNIVLLPGGSPVFVQACTVWRELIRTQAVEASDPFRYWAELPDPAPAK